MIDENQRSKVVPVAFLSVVTLTLCGGCAPVGAGELEEFVREMLLSAAAAFLL